MEKFAQIGMLLEIYGGLLTHRQRDVMDLYYNYDLSLSEVAEHFHISRQGVHDLIKRSEQILLNADRSVGALELRGRILKGLREIEGDLDEILNRSKEDLTQDFDKLKDELRDIKEKITKLSNL